MSYLNNSLQQEKNQGINWKRHVYLQSQQLQDQLRPQLLVSTV